MTQIWFSDNFRNMGKGGKKPKQKTKKQKKLKPLQVGEKSDPSESNLATPDVDYYSCGPGKGKFCTEIS